MFGTLRLMVIFDLRSGQPLVGFFAYVQSGIGIFGPDSRGAMAPAFVVVRS
jgi:hypothetical protein